jgi:drug/metabolite transporter (DMT)-like permease
MADVLEIFVQLLLLRCGPQRLPASGLLLILTVLAYAGVNGLVSCIFPPAQNWPALLLLDVGFLLLWNAAVLKLAGRPERILQTTTAVFGFQLLLAPLLVALDWLEQRLHGDPTWEGPLVVVGLVLLAWLVTVNSRIMSAALEWSMTASVALVVVQTLAEQLLQVALSVPVKG